MKRLGVLLVACLMVFGMSASAEVSFQFWTQEGEADGGFQFVQKLTDAYMEANPDVKIDLVSKGTEVYAKIIRRQVWLAMLLSCSGQSAIMPGLLPKPDCFSRLTNCLT
jgi:hypothetical protein